MAKWFLVDVDDGIVDVAPLKGALLYRNGYRNSSVDSWVSDKPVYRIQKDDADGIGGCLYVFSSEEQLIKAGFEWALKKDREDE